jgi:hypothetical protein
MRLRRVTLASGLALLGCLALPFTPTAGADDPPFLAPIQMIPSMMAQAAGEQAEMESLIGAMPDCRYGSSQARFTDIELAGDTLQIEVGLDPVYWTDEPDPSLVQHVLLIDGLFIEPSKCTAVSLNYDIPSASLLAAQAKMELVSRAMAGMHAGWRVVNDAQPLGDMGLPIQVDLPEVPASECEAPSAGWILGDTAVIELPE